MADAEGRLSWEVGPADSRPIRVLLYLAEGLLGGAVLSLFLSAVWVGGSLWNLLVLGWLAVGGGLFLLRLAV
jgi:hypothetical protein